MQRNHIPDPAEGGLSTEDLAQPRDRTEDEAAAAEAPTYPGEGTEPAREPAAKDKGTGRAKEPAAKEEAPQPPTTEDEDGFRSRWQEIQSQFVDDPREAVQTADDW